MSVFLYCQHWQCTVNISNILSLQYHNGDTAMSHQSQYGHCSVNIVTTVSVVSPWCHYTVCVLQHCHTGVTTLLALSLHCQTHDYYNHTEDRTKKLQMAAHGDMVAMETVAVPVVSSAEVTRSWAVCE